MKIFFTLLCLMISLLSCSLQHNSVSQKIDLGDKWDTIRPIANPDKGWYHHMLDNSIGKYLIQDDNDLISFPGMNHLYLRLAWAFLEPEEGKFDWSCIDTIVDKYVPLGYKVSFRISCKETGPAPTSVPDEIKGIRYATPYWVVRAGAKGIERPEYGSASWTPDYDDPVFLEKLDNFHKAFANRYDGKPWLSYVDVGSIGEWGEGHTYYSTKRPVSVAVIKKHMNLYLKHYKHSLLIVTDDLISYEKTKEEQAELLNYAIRNGFSLRDDSPMVKYHVENNLHVWTVLHPDFFEAVYKSRPIVYELEHYKKVKEAGHWIGENGNDLIPGIGVSGANIFRNSIKLMHPTYIGFHGYLGEWLKDNPKLTDELLNMCGYWYFPKSIHTQQYKDGNLTFEMEWLNKGVAPAYEAYQLKGKLIPIDEGIDTLEFLMEDSGNKRWMPNQIVTEKYTVALSVKPKGNYWLAIQLFDKKSKMPVDVGLVLDTKQDNYFLIQKLIF